MLRELIEGAVAAAFDDERVAVAEMRGDLQGVFERRLHVPVAVDEDDGNRDSISE